MKNSKLPQTGPPNAYELISVNYIALVDSIGTTCDNCGRLISNIATVEHISGKQYTIGIDCAKTLLKDRTYALEKERLFYKKKIYDKIKMLEANNKPYVNMSKTWRECL